MRNLGRQWDGRDTNGETRSPNERTKVTERESGMDGWKEPEEERDSPR